MIQEELRIFIEQNCSGKEPSDLIMEAIGKKIEQLGADADEVLTFVEECTKGPTLEEKAEEAKRKAEAEAKANEELQEIIENLERALVDLKSGKDIKKNKAEIERYARKAKMYYGSNPKIQKLLEEIEIETDLINKKVKKEESTEKRNNNINNLGCTISFLCFAVPLVLSFYYDGNLPNNVTAVWFVGILGGWFFIYRKFIEGREKQSHIRFNNWYNISWFY